MVQLSDCITALAVFCGGFFFAFVMTSLMLSDAEASDAEASDAEASDAEASDAHKFFPHSGLKEE